MQYKQLLKIIIIALAVSACNTLPFQNHTASVAVATAPTDLSSSASTVDKNNAMRVQPTPQSLPDQSDLAEKPAKKNHVDVWLRIKEKLTIERHINNSSVKSKLAWYKRNQDYLDRVTERARPYIYYIVEELEKRNMPLELALLPIIESAYHPFAYSPSRASGIWQFIPSTGKQYGLKQNWWYDGRRDIVEATRAALDYLEKLNRKFNGDWLQALAAYNSGETTVARAIGRNKRTGKKGDFWSLRLPRETRGYVPSLLAIAELVAEPEKHGIKWQQISNQPHFSQIDVGSQLDLAMAAKLADLSMDELYTLNPAFNRWATDPKGPHTFLIPADKQKLFSEKLAQLPKEERISWKRHVIQRGDTLGQIAERYHTSIATLKYTNGLRRDMIREGRSLLIPTSKQSMKFYTLSLDARRFMGLQRAGSGEKYIYNVRRGDTLWDIGNHYGVSVRQLCAWNGIASHSILRPRQKLNLWLSASGEALTGQTVAANTINYTVRKGDSLWLISKRFGTSVSRLRQWNKLPKGKYLQPGQKLVLHRQQIQQTDV